jgi:hypothetical protein
MKLPKRWSDYYKDHAIAVQKSALLVFSTLLLTIVMTSFTSQVISKNAFEEGQIARRSVRSPVDFLIEDRAATERARQEKQRSVRRIFTLEDTGEYDVERKAAALFDTLDQLFPIMTDAAAPELSAKDKSRFERLFNIDLVGKQWELISERSRWEKMQDLLVTFGKPIVAKGIVGNKEALLDVLHAHGAVLRVRSTGAERDLYSSSSLYDIIEAERALFQLMPEEGFGNGQLFDSLMKKLLAMYAKPNVFIDTQATEVAILAARNSVKPVYSQVQRGEVIVRAGDRISAEQERKIAHLAKLSNQRSISRTALGYCFLIIIILVTVYFFTENMWPTFRPSSHDLALLAITLIGSVLLVRVFTIFGDSLRLSFPDLDAAAFVLASPVAAGGILLEVTLGASSVFMFIMSFSLLTGVFLEESWLFLLFIIIGNIVGAVSVKHCPRRSFFLWSGIRVAGINVLIVACFFLLAPQIAPSDMMWRVFLAIVSGLMSGILATGLTPVAEYIGSYVTDIKLLEMASLDRPLLRELATQAPGTWNHSMIMGQISEAAAESIGANGLLTRVGAYYHDIGKLNKPRYFVENQSDGANRHEKLSPSMSVLIIKAHVKDGIELARQHNIPKAIIDFIPQHHGTSLIEFFYDKAKTDAEEGEIVDENVYRYPGPKPQTREAGILMLADAVEASSRTLTDPTPAKIQGLVQKMINRVFIKGQLDESDLTLRDLHLIAKSFTRVLSGIFHRRIQYSEPAEKVSKSKTAEASASDESVSTENVKNAEGPKKNGSRRTGDTSTGEGSRESSGSGEAEASSTDALKRLGM